MTTYKVSEKWPKKDQYCFIKNKGEWIFCMYQGNEEDPDRWGFFRNPASLNLGVIEEWQPAYIQLANPSVDILSKKAWYDLVDVVNDENHSFWEQFKNTVGDHNVNSDRADSDSKGGGEDLSAEVPVLRPDCVESV